jgi:hypothetical protein
LRLTEFSKYLHDDAQQRGHFRQDTADEEVVKNVIAYSDAFVGDVAAGRAPGP